MPRLRRAATLAAVAIVLGDLRRCRQVQAVAVTVDRIDDAPERQPAKAGDRHVDVQRRHDHERQACPKTAEQGEDRQLAPGDRDVARSAVGTFDVRMGQAQTHDRDVRDRE